MSMDKSLRSKSALNRARSVLTRAERIKMLQDQDRWTPEQGPFGLPKVRVRRLVIRAKKAAKGEETAAAAAEAPAAGAGKAPAAGAGKAPAAGAGKAPAAAKKK